MGWMLPERLVVVPIPNEIAASPSISRLAKRRIRHEEANVTTTGTCTVLVHEIRSTESSTCRGAVQPYTCESSLVEDAKLTHSIGFGWLVGWYILFYFARMNRHCCLLAWTSGLSKLSQKDEERKEILHESVKHAILYIKKKKLKKKKKFHESVTHA